MSLCEHKLLVDAKTAAEMLGISRSKFYALHSAGKTPQEIRLGEQPRWSIATLQEWISFSCPSRDRFEQLRRVSK